MYAFNHHRILGTVLSAVTLLHITSRARALDPADIGYELHDKATATVSVSLTEVYGETRFAYSVRNASYSARSIISFEVQIDVPTSSITASNPASWDPFNCCFKDVARTNASGLRAGGWLYGDEPARISPGNTLSGFGIRARSLPAIKKFFIRSDSPTVVPSAEPGNEKEAQELVDLTDFFNDSTSGWTLGPDPMPATFDPTARVNRLITLKHKAADLGWLGGAKLVEKLDQRLDQASAALTAGKKCVARARLDQFVHRLANAHDKPSLAPGNARFASDDAFLLLKSNAESITPQLPKTPKDPAEERECKQVEEEKDDDE